MPRTSLTTSSALALLGLKRYNNMIKRCKHLMKRFSDSEFHSSFQYMIALAHFWKHNYAGALDAAKRMAGGDSKNRNYASYIVAQIYHTRKNGEKAIKWYSKVSGKYLDAKQAIQYFRQQNISLPEVSIFRPNENVEVELQHRNINETEYQVYRVDLMKPYLLEKNLSQITDLHLAGIEPMAVGEVELTETGQFGSHTSTISADLQKEGPYPVIYRGDDLFSSGLVLMTPLELDVQQYQVSGRVRGKVTNRAQQSYIPGLHVKAIGSRNDEFRSGETDLRGVYVAEDVKGKVTAIARQDKNRTPSSAAKSSSDPLRRTGSRSSSRNGPRRNRRSRITGLPCASRIRRSSASGSRTTTKYAAPSRKALP